MHVLWRAIALHEIESRSVGLLWRTYEGCGAEAAAVGRLVKGSVYWRDIGLENTGEEDGRC